MKKLLAILLAAAMLFAFAACGDDTTGETTTTTAAEEVTDEAPVEESTDAVEDTSAADTSDVSTEEPSSEETSAEETSAPAADAEMTKADFVAFFNAETAKAAKASYNYNRNCSYTDPIDVGSATDALNSLISSLSDGTEDINSVVGGFLGIGTKTGSVPKDDPKSNYKLKAAALKEADLGSFSYADGVYSFTLANASNPQKDNSTPFARFSNDFITHQEVVDGVAEAAGSAITVTNTNVNYKNIKVEVKVEGGKIVNIKYSYAFDAVLNLKLAIIKIEGTGAAVTKAEFSNIKY